MAGQGQDLKQGVYRSPPDFMAVVRYHFPFFFDLAASHENTQAPNFWTEKENSLSRSWHNINVVSPGGWLWLNPPYGNIGEWAEKCAEESKAGAKILFLVPAGVGSNWYADHVHGNAEIRALRPRLVFDFLYPIDYKGRDGKPSPKAGKRNTDPYPKDLILCLFDYARKPVFHPWKWK